MALHIPPTATSIPEWIRKAATAINSLLVRQPFPLLAAEPADPVAGQAYWDTTLGKARVFDGTSWQNLN